MEILSRMLDKACALSYLHGFKLSSGGPPISYLLQVDDIIVFGQATLLEARALNQCLKLFLSWFGQAPNAKKSSVFITCNTPLASARGIRDFFAFEDLSSKSGHVGLPLFLNQSKSLAFKDVFHHIDHKITGWKSKLLS